MPVPHVLLRLLMDGPSHGYDLHQKLTAYQHLYPLRNVNVYPTLRSLEEQGLVSSHRELCDSRMRKVYAITQEGTSDFAGWIQAAPETPLPAEKDVLALKLVLATKGDAQGLGWLAEAIASVEEEIEQTRASLESEVRERATPLAVLAAEYRLRSYERRREFLRDAMRLALGRERGEPNTDGVKRVLVVDDSSAARTIHRHLLSAAGYEVRVAEDTAQAWELLQSSDFDALVSDTKSPVLDGLALIHRVRSHDALADLPVVINTVRADTSERDAALAAGANDFVCKKDANAARLLVDSLDRLTGRSVSSPG